MVKKCLENLYYLEETFMFQASNHKRLNIIDNIITFLLFLSSAKYNFLITYFNLKQNYGSLMKIIYITITFRS